MSKTATKEQFIAFRTVQLSGKTNMANTQEVIAECLEQCGILLTREKISIIREYYPELARKYL